MGIVDVFAVFASFSALTRWRRGLYNLDAIGGRGGAFNYQLWITFRRLTTTYLGLRFCLLLARQSHQAHQISPKWRLISRGWISNTADPEGTGTAMWNLLKPSESKSRMRLWPAKSVEGLRSRWRWMTLSYTPSCPPWGSQTPTKSARSSKAWPRDQSPPRSPRSKSRHAPSSRKSGHCRQVWVTVPNFILFAWFVLATLLTTGFFTLFRHPGILKVPTFRVFTLSFEFFPSVLSFFLSFDIFFHVFHIKLVIFHKNVRKFLKKCPLSGL